MSESSVIELFFDVGSPYSYLASTQVASLRERTGRPVRMRPFLLGAVMKETGNDSPARVASKARYMLDDLTRWAEQYGVPFRFSSRFPVNTLTAQRALVAAERLFGQEAMERLAHRLFAAIWVEDRDVSSGDELAFCANDAGLDAKKLAVAVSSQEVKDALREATSEAIRRGAFGAPTFFAGETMVWGNDRIDLLVEMLRAKSR